MYDLTIFAKKDTQSKYTFKTPTCVAVQKSNIKLNSPYKPDI